MGSGIRTSGGAMDSDNREKNTGSCKGRVGAKGRVYYGGCEHIHIQILPPEERVYLRPKHKRPQDLDIEWDVDDTDTVSQCEDQ